MKVFSKALSPNENFNSLDQLDDVLYGGVVGFDEDEKVEFIWRNAAKSKRELDKETAKVLLDQQKHDGLFELVVSIIKNHDNVTLELL